MGGIQSIKQGEMEGGGDMLLKAYSRPISEGKK